MLESGARVGVIGGGPAGSLFSYFFLRLAELIELDVSLEIFEPRSFRHQGPAGCNHCGGVVSESLVQTLASEGVNVPEQVVQRGIDSYVLHTDVGSVRIETPLREKRIAAVYRGNGPRDSVKFDGFSFDGHVLELARAAGATIVPELVRDLGRDGDRPEVVTNSGRRAQYDLLVIAVGVNSNLLEGLGRLTPGYRRPRAVKTFITEYYLGKNRIDRELGSSMHVFLLDLRRLKFGALIPKGDFVTVCMLGHDIDAALVEAFLGSKEVRACFPNSQLPPNCCHCFPRINVGPQGPAYADRVLFVGDSGVTRLYKDGLGAAYRTAKAAATTALLQGVSAEAFRRFFWPTCRRIDRDNRVGKLLFVGGVIAQRLRFLRRGMLRLTAAEQRSRRGPRRLSGILWDLFTGSTSYTDVFRRTLSPVLAIRLVWNVIVGFFSRRRLALPERSDANG